MPEAESKEDGGAAVVPTPAGDAYPVDAEKAVKAVQELGVTADAKKEPELPEKGVATPDATKDKDEAAITVQKMVRGKAARASSSKAADEATSADASDEKAAEEGAKEDEEEPPPVSPPKKEKRRSSILDGGLNDILSMLDNAMTQSSAATSLAEEAKNEAKKADEHLNKQRRRSREIEDQVFGMHLKEIDQLRAKFDEIDEDGSGAIDTSELRAALLKCGKNPTDKQIKTMIAVFDENGDGVLQFSEFQKMIRDWEKILAEHDDEEKRLEAAKKAGAQQKFVLSNEPSAEEKKRRKSVEMALLEEEGGAPGFALSRNSSQASVGPGASGGRRSRRASKEYAESIGAKSIAEDSGTPSGGGLSAARALSSTSGTTTPKRVSKEEMDTPAAANA